MIVPRIRIIVISAVLLLPAAIWAERATGSVGVVTITVIAWIFITGIDAGYSRKRLAKFAVKAPGVIRMTVGRSSHIYLTATKSSSAGCKMRIGLALPEAIMSKQHDLMIIWYEGQTALKIPWPCEALRRGRFPITRCHIEIASVLGLWSLRREIAMEAEVRAYPNLVVGQHRLLGLFRHREWGMRTQRRVGKGREFEQLRDYLPGDSYEDIDWKATARRRHPVTRVYQVERAQEIYMVLDASRLSTRDAQFLTERRLRRRGDNTTARMTIFDHYVIAALVMAVVADQASDRFGLLIFSNKPDCLIRAGRGHAHYNACRESLYNRVAHTVSPDYDELFAFIGTHLRKRALLVFLTGLDDPMLADSFINAMQAASRRHVLMVNMLRPPQAHPLFTSADIRQIQGIYQHLAGHTQWESLIETRRRLRRYGAGFSLLETNQLCSQLVSQYLEVKQRQVL